MSRTTGRTTAALAMLVVTLLGCTLPDDDAEPPPAPDQPAVVAPGEADALRVLLAVVILTAGDVDAAVAEGVVTPEELDLASEAIDTGSVTALFEEARLAIEGG
jgi:hypothetical protein